MVPIFFHGQNSRAFHIVSHLSKSLQMAFLIRETKARFDVTIGDTLPHESLEDIKRRKALTDYLYDAVQQLAEA